MLWRACWSKSKPQSPVPSLGSHWCGTVGNAACKNVLIKPTAMGAMVKSLLHAHRRTRAHKECMCIKKSPVIEQGLCVWAGRAKTVARPSRRGKSSINQTQAGVLNKSCVAHIMSTIGIHPMSAVDPMRLCLSILGPHGLECPFIPNTATI